MKLKRELVKFASAFSDINFDGGGEKRFQIFKLLNFKFLSLSRFCSLRRFLTHFFIIRCVI